MAQVLQTTTVLTKGSGSFSLLTEYSSEVNPNVTFNFLLTVTDSVPAVIIGATVTINGISYVTDNNGQVSVDLVRGSYSAVVSKQGYMDGNVTFTILDENVSENITLTSIGSFGMDYNESYN